MNQISYSTKYRHIYIKVSEFILSAKSISVYKEYVIPIVRKIVKNYSRFRKEVINEKEKLVCDEYIRSMEKMITIIERKIRYYEQNRDFELDIV